MLKAEYQKREDIPSGLEEHYTEEDGIFRLQADGIVSRKFLEQSQQQIEQTKKEAAAAKAALEKFSKVDVEEYSKLKAEKEKTANTVNTATPSPDLEFLIQQRVERLKQDHLHTEKMMAEKLSAIQSEKEQLQKQYESSLIETQVQLAVNEIGKARQNAMSDIINRAKSAMRIEDNKLIIRDNSGNVLYSKNGQQVMDPKEWALNLADQCPYFFESASGGGAPGAAGTFGNNSYINKNLTSIPANRPDLINSRLEDIASGKVVVRAA